MLQLIKTHLPPREELIPKLEEVLYSGYIAQGDIVEEFERKFEQFIGSGYTLSLNSGTAALHIALILAGNIKTESIILLDAFDGQLVFRNQGELVS
jgi:dTDP-4-amino-4,6-dideoxygalactose transaminase